MYDHILIPTDGSDAAEVAVEHAVALAQRFDATLHILYVVDTSMPAGLETMGADWEGLRQALEDEGQAALDGVEERAEAAGVTCERVLKRSPVVHRAIIEHTKEAGIDLVVMGTHGRSGFGRWLLGSVTDRVMRTAGVPVMAVRADGESE